MNINIKVGKNGLTGIDFANALCDASKLSDSFHSVSTIGDIEELLPIGYSVVDNETLQSASTIISREYGSTATIAMRINSIIKNGLLTESEHKGV